MVGRIGEQKSSFSSYQDQGIFLKVVSRLTPQFWRELRETVLPRLPADFPRRARRRRYTDAELSPIREPFDAWVKRFDIESVAWLQKVALRTLCLWRDYPETTDFDMGGSEMEWSDNTATFTWDPLTETRKAFLSRVERATKGISERLPPFPQPLAERHAEWLALHKFAGLTRGEIRQWEWARGNRQGAEEDVSVIQKGWETAGRRLGIPTARPRGRRPRK